MIANLRNWFSALTAREQVLVGVAGVLAAFVLLVFGIVMPVGHALDDAAVRHRLATERAGRIAAQMAALKAAPPVQAVTLAGPVDQVAGASAQEAGFVIQSSQRKGGDMAVVVIPTARPSAALAWLDGLATQGLVVDQLTMTPAPDGSVSINVILRRSGS